MKREIKFNAWDSFQKKMYEWHQLVEMDIKGELTLSNFLNGFVKHIKPLQYIGLLDKHGKEIFEGHIVKPFSDDINIAQIIYLAPKFVIATKKKDGSYLLWSYFKDDIEIIGNIHQDKNLLK